MKHTFRLCIPAVFCLALVPAETAQTVKPVLAVQTFENPTTGANSTIGNAVTDILFTELGRTGRFQLVERAAFNEIAKEIDFGSSDWVKRSSATTRGGMAGANFIIFGKVTNFSFNETQFSREVQTATGMAHRTMYRQNATVRLDFRVVSVLSGLAVVTESGSDSRENESATSEIATFARLMRAGSFTSEALNSLIGRTTIGAIQNAVRKISDLYQELQSNLSDAAEVARLTRQDGVSGRITGLAGGAVFVDLGTPGHGLQKGDRLSVFEEEVTRNQKGDVIFTEHKNVAVLQVLALDGRNAKTQLVVNGVAGGRDPREGDIVRPHVDRTATSTGDKSVSPDPDRLIRQADRYVEDKYFTQAIDTYRKALELQPDNRAVVSRLFHALLHNKQWVEAEDLMYEKLLPRGGVTFTAFHNHAFFGECQGLLSIASGQIAYFAGKGDHSFTGNVDNVVSLQEGSVGNIPVLTIRIRDEKGKEKNYDIWVATFVTRYTPTEIMGDDEDVVSNTSKLHRLLIEAARNGGVRR